MKNYPKRIKNTLHSVIRDMAKHPEDFCRCPEKDFTRNRKLPFERQLAIERRKIKSFDYPRIHAFLEQMKGLNCANLSDRSKLATMFIHTIFYYDDYLLPGKRI